MGPYCTAAIANGFAYLSGILGVDPATGRLAEGGVQAQTRQITAHIATVLSELGLSPANVVKALVFLADMGDFAAMNEAYAETFGANPPARSCVAVKALPMGALVEIEVIASM